jgi:hypothetical protein
MLDKTSLEEKKILVLFNIEFLQVLVEERKINPENIYYIADNELEYLSAIKIFKVQSYKLSDFSVPVLKKLIAGIDMKFDVVFSNPPYNSNIDIKILNEIIDISDEFVVVHPSTWLMDLKGKKDLFQDFKKSFHNRFKSIDLFNGNPVFNIDLFLPCCITHIQKPSDSSVEVKYFGRCFTFENIYNVTKYEDKWVLVKSFKNQIEQFISQNDSLWNKISKNSTNNFTYLPNKFLLQLPMGRGNCVTNDERKMIKEDFYTLFSNNSKEIESKNLSDKVSFASGNYFYFDSEDERLNCLNYLKTDFARFCLSFGKLNKNIHRGEQELIPWLDFTEEWDDDKLFAKFDVSQELQDYIRDFLPDYYGIRK